MAPAFMAMALLSASLPSAAQAGQISGNDLAAVVNAYRAANGYYALTPNSQVMAAAQAHAEWIVQTGQGGHIGANGSDETMRVSWTGYGGGAPIQCDENWSGGRSISEVMSGSWSDWVHQEVMLNAWGNRYTDIGGGVASRGSGSYVFVLNVCKVIGQEASGEAPESSGAAPGTTPNVIATTDLSNYVYGVTIATPLADGTIKHTVKYGQTLAAIAKAYGITINTLRELNGMAADETIIWPEEELLIQRGTGIAAAQASATPAPTASAPSQTQTPLPSLAVVSTPSNATSQANAEDDQPSPMAGILLAVVAAAGLAMILFSAFRKEQ